MDPTATRPKDANAFDLLRVLLALLVFYSHMYAVGGFGDEGLFHIVKGQTIAGSLAVLGFFGISGFLVTGSYCTRNNGVFFVASRALRILPGFYFALLLTAFVFAPAISHLNPSSGGWVAKDAFSFVFSNALVQVRAWSIGTVLAGFPFSGSINGALWTLMPEVCCYGLVLVFGLAGILRGNRANLILITLAFAVFHIAIVVAPGTPFLSPTLLQLNHFSSLVAAFFMGALLYRFRPEFEFGPKAAVVWSIAVLITLKFGGWSILGPFLLPLALINIAHSLRFKVPVDISYGMYVLHFPVLQLVYAAGFARRGVLLYATVSLLVLVPFALLSWFLVEKPALRLKKGRAMGPSPQFPAAVGRRQGA